MLSEPCNYGCAMTTPIARHGGTMIRKSVILLSGTDGIDDDRWNWHIRMQIRRDGVLSTTGIPIAQQCRAHYLKNREAVIQKSREWAEANPDRRDEIRAKWREDNPEEHRRTTARANKKSHAKRKEMGFSPLNEPFDGSCGHHVNNDQVIFVPEEMHRRYHNLATGQGMAEINALAFQYLFKQT